MTFSPRIIKELLQTSDPQIKVLKESYARLPTTRCRRRTHCCAMLPEMTLVEALPVMRWLGEIAPDMRKRLIQRFIEYFFLNSVEITSCPFLEGQECLIYPDRFFGCRSYGLWSRAYYEIISTRDRKAKKHLKEQWKRLGVSLPKNVVDFQVPYCMCVETAGPQVIDDQRLLEVSDAIEANSAGFSSWHQSFGRRYFSDLSFLISALTFGYEQAVKTKFILVRDMVRTGDRTKLGNIIQEVPDLCEALN